MAGHRFVSVNWNSALGRYVCHCGLSEVEHRHQEDIGIPNDTPEERAEHPDSDSPLRKWWTDQAFDEADRTISKMEQYGSMDLVHIGRALWDVMGRADSALTDAAAMEIGCLFYCYGKIQRAMSALKSNQQILDDTWFDMHIYPKMAEAARAGVWPLS